MKDINSFNVRLALFDESMLRYDKTVIVELMCTVLSYGETCYYGGKQLVPSEDNKQFTVNEDY